MRTGRQLRSLGVAVAVTMLALPRANAQRTPIVSLDASIGASGSVTNGDVYESAAAGPAADLTFAIRFAPARSGFVAAVNMTAYSVPIGGDVCHVTLPGDGHCIPDHPSFAMVGALAGWESRGSRVRAMAGLGAAYANWDVRTLGIQARVDGAIPIIPHVSLIGSLRGMLVPNHDHGTYGLLGLGFGLRLRTG